jgi:preprotein translocase subunit SecE
MSEERLEPTGESESQSDKKVRKNSGDKKQKRKNPVVKWLREMRSELKKVVWPTPKQITNNTILVLVIIAVSSVVIFAVDQAGVYITQSLILLGGH